MPLTLNQVKSISRSDPTRTTMIRRSFEAELTRRIRSWMDDVYYFLVIQDALGLKGVGRNPLIRLTKTLPATLTANSFSFYLTNPPPPIGKKQFEFRTDPAKIEAFQVWLEQQRQARLLTPVGPGIKGKPWTAKYVESAYKRGIINAYMKAKKEQALADEVHFDKSQAEFLLSSFNTPETVRKLELVSTRSFEELKGITADMAGKMNRTLAQGLLDGDGPDKIAKAMFDEVDGITKRRALLVARTEVINVHAEGQLDTFEELNIDEVGVEAEWLTAGDDRVCPECEAMEGKTFTVDEARGLIPLHPNCRCSWTPAL